MMAYYEDSNHCPKKVYEVFQRWNKWYMGSNNDTYKLSFCENSIPFKLVTSKCIEELTYEMKRIFTRTGFKAENMAIYSSTKPLDYMWLLGDDGERYTILSNSVIYNSPSRDGFEAKHNTTFSLIHTHSATTITDEIIRTSEEMPLKDACTFVNCLEKMGV